MLCCALDAEIKRIAGTAATGEIADELRQFVDENPLLITTAAIGAATAWVLANQGIGLLSTRLQLGGGHSLIGGVDPGKTLELAVERVRLGYRYKGGGTDLKVIGDYFADDSWKVTGGFSQATDFGGRASITGLHHQRGADESRTRLGVGYTQDGLSASAFWERERSIGSDVSTLGQLSRQPRRLVGLHAGAGEHRRFPRGGCRREPSPEQRCLLGCGRVFVVGRAGSFGGVRAVFRWTF